MDGLWYTSQWNSVTRQYDRFWQTSLAPIGFFKHGTNVLRNTNNANNEEGEMVLVTNIVAAAAVGMSSSCAGLPNKEVKDSSSLFHGA